MFKKFQGENIKLVVVWVWRVEVKVVVDVKKQKELEDVYWKDDDKYVMRKEQCKEEKEKWCFDQLECKKEMQCLLEEEDFKFKGGKVLWVVMFSKVIWVQIEDMLC